MSISKISSNAEQNLDPLLETNSAPFQECIRVADKVKNVVIGLTLAVAGTTFYSPGVFIKYVVSLEYGINAGVHSYKLSVMGLQ